ncbi:MucR family transcriptional regulator [Geodermatophilus sp. URMC 63]
MLHPVGPLPAAVYWRRRLLALVLLLAVLGGGVWLGAALLTGSDGEATAAEATTTSTPAGAPALDRVVPSLASVQTPTPPPTSPPAPAPAAPAAPAAPVQEAGAPCRDDVLALEVRTPGTVATGSRPVFELVVTNTATVPCTRVLDKGLQEMVLLDAGGNRLWGSNDCVPEVSSDTRTLAPGEQVVFPLTWSGTTSEPTCTAARVPVGPGQYVLRARLDTKTSPDAVLQIS